MITSHVRTVDTQLAHYRWVQPFRNYYRIFRTLMQPASNATPTLRLALDEAANVLSEGPHPARARRDAETLLLDVLRQNSPQA